MDLPFTEIEMNEQLLKEPEIEPVLIKSASLNKNLDSTTGEFNESRKILIVEDNEELRRVSFQFYFAQL